MKKIIIVLAVIAITTFNVLAQEQVQTDSLKVKCETKVKQLEKEINEIIFSVAMNDPQVVQRLNQLLATIPEYNVKVGEYNAVKELLKELEPAAKKEEGK